jgi:DNA replication protein DnaC
MFEKIMNTTIETAKENTVVNPDDYKGDDGLLYCGICRTAKQCRIEFLGMTKTPFCLCKCQQEKRDREEEQRKQIEKLQEIARNRSIAFSDSPEFRNWTFENDDKARPELTNAALKYVENFEKFKSHGKGLLIYGTVGTGKSFISGCIANELINRGYSVLMTSFAAIESRTFGADNKQEHYNNLNRYSLLIIDDLGIERQTSYMQEIVYNVIDNRCRMGLPLIVTSNLTNEQLRNPSDINAQRIYSRILQMCHPIKVDGIDRRKQAAQQDYVECKAILGI